MKSNEENLFEVLANIETIQELIKNKEEKNGKN
ncbi:unknown [Clostridium sp. CAG:1219]|nr:unknown [Clostridium sp. CAG:1219]